VRKVRVYELGGGERENPMKTFVMLLMIGGGLCAQTVVTLERGPCYGPCPVYRLTLYDSGKIVFEGKNHVRAKGTQTATISKEQVAELVAGFEKAGYFRFKDRYTAHHITDLPTTVTSVQVGRRVKRIEHYHGDSSAPKILSALENKIDAVVGSKRWIGSGEQSSRDIWDSMRR
jgi:hypothetical protein